jgi:hypothetical protein
VVFFILCFAIVNLGLGYGLALYLHGHGDKLRWPSGFGFPGRLRSLWPGKDLDEGIEEPADSARPEQREQRLPPIGEAAAARPPSDDESKKHDSQAVELPAAKTPAASNSHQAPAASDAGFAPAANLSPKVDERAVAAAVKGLKTELGLYRAEITTLDARLRDCAVAPDEPTVRSCAERLRTISRQYLERQESHRERLSGDVQTNEASSAPVRDIIELAGRQAKVVASVQAEMAFLRPEADLLAQCERMLQETRHISQTSNELHAAIGTALAAIAPASIDTLSANEPAAVVRKEIVA